MKVIVPFNLTSIPMKKLALINFEKDPDEIYRGLELQFLDGLPYGTGWRIIAYRNDNYVDVYDDHSLNTIENERFDVAEKGLNQHMKTNLNEVRFDKDEEGVHICFSFQDMLNRNILVRIHEHTKRKSKAMNLLAPIGAGSENPNSLPLFFLYRFDFVRRNNTEMLIAIDGKMRRADNFPFPITKELQWRYYSRYSMDCHMLELAKSKEGLLKLVELDENNSYTDGGTTYIYDVNEKGISLKKMTIKNDRHQAELVFEQALPIMNEIDREINGLFYINTDPVMGTVKGKYKWRQENGIYSIKIVPDEGWSGVPNSFITKVILNPKSVFCTWPKTYQYMQRIRVDSLESKSEWIRL